MMMRIIEFDDRLNSAPRQTENVTASSMSTAMTSISVHWTDIEKTPSTGTRRSSPPTVKISVLSLQLNNSEEPCGVPFYPTMV